MSSKDRSSSSGHTSGFRSLRSCPFDGKGIIDYKDARLLQKYVTERGRKLPSRVTRVSRKRQRELSRAIERARFIGLLPYMAS